MIVVKEKLSSIFSLGAPAAVLRSPEEHCAALALLFTNNYYL